MRLLRILTIELSLLQFIFNYESNGLEKSDDELKYDFSVLNDDDVFDLWKANGCGEFLGKKKPIHGHENWTLMRKAYEKVVGSKSTLKQPSSSGVNGFIVDYLPLNQGNTRGIFANQKIRKSQVVYDHMWLGSFPDSKSFIDFLDLLPKDFTCDLITWGYNFEDDPNWTIIDFDDMSYLSGKGKPNIDYVGKNFEMLALRDIEAGEELICDKHDLDDDDDLGDGYNLLLSLNKCDQNSIKKRPILGKSFWYLMERIYEEVVESYSTMKGSFGVNGIKFKYSIKYTEHMGRGFFAGERIPKGQIMYEHIKYAYFPDQDSLAEFLNRMISYEHKRTSDNHPNPEPYLDFLNRFPKGLACDISMWVQEDDWEGVSVSDRVGIGASIDFDDGCYCNDGGDRANMDYVENDNAIDKQYALRDIDEGEEILCKYGFADN